MNKPVYVLGTGLSHDGSSCLLKDGELIVAIEKERLTRKKHDGGNDLLTVEYCLDAAGININDVSLVVQCANFEKETIQKDNYCGRRLFKPDVTIPFVTISHHLAHAYSAIGTSPFAQCNVIVIDGCGSFYKQCDDLVNAFIPDDINSSQQLYAEKDSFYFFDGQALHSLYKDFSVLEFTDKANKISLPTTSHSIGGLYSMASQYCFCDPDAAGKLMGLAPYGKAGLYKDEIFTLKKGRVTVNKNNVLKNFTLPAESIQTFNNNFQYYADIARWVQEETEKAISYIFKHRQALHPSPSVCYAGGVALNAVANTNILLQKEVKNLYIEPAAGDNGLAIGCAYYGWLAVLKKEKVQHIGTTLLGKNYCDDDILQGIKKYKTVNSSIEINFEKEKNYIRKAAAFLQQGKTIGWFQSGSEFGPRALGRRSILANPCISNIQWHINHNIKFREDFRPFAPAVLYEDRNEYFENGFESPYMILVDRIREKWKDKLPGIVHVDGTCRVQTVKDAAEPFYQLLEAYKKLTGISVLLNTSFNCKAMPIVETPEEAISFFYTCALDVLIINDYIITNDDHKISPVTLPF